MKILWISNSPHSPSAYGQQTAYITKALKERGFDIKIHCNHWSELDVAADLKYEGMDLFVGHSHERPLEFMRATLYNFEPDLTVFLGDPWVHTPDLMDFPEKFPLAVWYPIDCDPLSSADVPVLSRSDYIIPISEHGEIVLDAAGLAHTQVIPHVIDTNLFVPRPELKNPEEFVVGMVAANVGTRKLIPLQLEAVAMAREDIEDLALYLHMDVFAEHSPWGINYAPLVNYFGLDNCTYFPEDERGTTKAMTELYPRFDVLLNATAGEGFGVPIIEAAACGVPAITSDNSAARFVNPGTSVPTIVREYVPVLNSFHSWPDPRGIADALIDVRENQSEDHLLPIYASQFDVQKIVDEEWVPLLREVEEVNNVGRT